MTHNKPAMKKHYPDKNIVRNQGRCIQQAMRAIARLGIEVISIDFTGLMPVIQIHYSSGAEQITGIETTGRGYKNTGLYVRKITHIKGCQVEWDEVIK